MNTITVTELEKLDSATIVDVREPHEYANGHVPGAILMPLSTVTDQSSQLPKEQPIFVICQSGNRSKSGVALLEAQGFEALNVEGGTSAWIAAGKPIATGADLR